MAVRLIRTVSALRRLHVVHRHVLLGSIHTTLLSTVVVVGIRDTLVVTVWQVLLAITSTTTSLLVLGSAAADSEEPEETACDGESNCNPGGDKESEVQRCVDAVDLGDCLEGCDGNGGFGCGHDRGADDGCGGETGEDIGKAGADAGAECNETNNELSDCEEDGDHVDDFGPFVDNSERLQRSGHIFWNRDIVGVDSCAGKLFVI